MGADATARPFGEEARSVWLKLAEAVSTISSKSGQVSHRRRDAETNRQTGAIVIKIGLSLKLCFKKLHKTRVGKRLWWQHIRQQGNVDLGQLPSAVVVLH